MYEINFNTVKDDKGDVIGFSMQAEHDRHSEKYVESLPTWLTDDTVNIAISRDTIIFAHKEVDKNLKVIWNADELAALEKILNSGKELKLGKLGLRGLLSTGFKITRP